MAPTLPILTATRWIDFKGSGRTRPALVGCDLPEGGEVECVVKMGGHHESADHQPVCEIVAALLALDLGLPVAEPLLVEVTPEFVQRGIPAANQEARRRCGLATGLSFATRHLPPGYSAIPNRKPPPRTLLPVLAELYAFDGLIQNVDRTAPNPNCLVNGDDFSFFDHDQAFGFLLDIFGPGSVSAIDSYGWLRTHFAHPHLPRERKLFNRLEGAWEAITSDTLATYRALLPDAWPGKMKYFHGIESYLGDVSLNLAKALDAITMTLHSS